MEQAFDVEQNRSHGVAIATLVMLAIMIATVVGWWVLLPEIAPKRITIAVLPFEQARGPRPAPPHLGEGIAADIAIALAEVPDFIVLDRAASFSYAARGAARGDVSQLLAGELGATHVVEGRVRRSEGGTALSARLTGLSEFQLLWEDDLSGDDADLFVMRDAIAAAIAKKLVLLGDVAVSAGPPVDLRAYETFLEARAVADAGNTTRAATLAERSLALDADNAYAHFLLAELYHGDGRRDAAAAHTADALALDPGSAPAQALRAHLRFLADGDLTAYHGTLTDLVAARRDADALRWLTCLYDAVGRSEDARFAGNHLRQFDPLGARGAGCTLDLAVDPAAIGTVSWRSAEEVLATPITELPGP